MKKTILLVLVLALAQVANADFTFGTPVEIPNVNCSVADAFPSLSADGLTLVFGRDFPNGDLVGDLWVTTRATGDDNWNNPVKLSSTVNSSADETCPSLSADGRSLFFSSFVGTPRPGGHGQGDIWVSTRATASDPWGAPANLGPPVNTWSSDVCPFIWGDGCTLLFSSNRAGGPGGWDLWKTTRETTDDDWSTPVPLENVNNGDTETAPTMSPDGRVLLFQRGAGGSVDLWMATRKRIDEPFGLPVKVPAPINYLGYDDSDPHFSSDGSTLYFCSNRAGGSGGYDLWQAPILPIVDFNGDGIVDARDMSILVDDWHTSEPLCDIGPTPWGDGIVDVNDLIVLSQYLEPGFGRIAHWRLDETYGTVAHDSIGHDHANVHGGAIWRPDAGQMAGALEFDGIDDYVAPMCVLNPQERPFRIVAWIKGGAPGQVIASQTLTEFGLGSTYLAADPTDGTFMTEAVLPMPLKSDVIITDGEWHEVGLEWDGNHRHLYADDNEVAVDAMDLPALENTGWLNIGTGMDTESGTFWFGLIDDVRVYKKGKSVASSQ